MDVYKRVPLLKNDRIHCPICSKELKFTRKPVCTYDHTYHEVQEIVTPLLKCNKCQMLFLNEFVLEDLQRIDDTCLIETFVVGRNETKADILDKVNIFPMEYMMAQVTESHNKEYLRKFPPLEYELSEIERELTPEIFDEYKCPNSTIGIVFYEMPKHPKETLRKAYIVMDKRDENPHKRGSYHVSHPYAKVVMQCLGEKEKSFTYQEQERQLHYFCGNNDFYSRLSGYARLSVFSQASFETPVKICVYHGKGLCYHHGRHMEVVTARIISARSKEHKDLQVYYCPDCDEYYINYDYYREFSLKNGIPPLALYDKYSHGIGYDYYSGLNQESKLALYGYRVSEIPDTRKRQNLLEDLIDTELLEKSEIMSHIEWLIRNRPHNYNAIPLWKADLNHVRNYNKNSQRIVIGNIKAGKGKYFR